MKLVCVFILQILLLIATHVVFVYSNFMDNLVSFVKAISSNHTPFDLKKLIDKTDENYRPDANKEAVNFNLIHTIQHDDKSNHTIGDKSTDKDTVNNTNPILLQLPKDLDYNLTKNNSVTLQKSKKEDNNSIDDKSKDTNSVLLQFPIDSDFNSTTNRSVTSQSTKNHSKEMVEIYDIEDKLNVATPYSIIEGRRVNLMRGNSFHDEQRNENKDYVNQASSSSSSRELPDWKVEFKKLWQHKKFEALNQTRPSGDNTNMLGARPWGVQCGDPAQHDMPWGNCLLAMECEPEYRIYRGDVFCGRTTFVCCSLQLSTYDMYQGFDVSFAEKNYYTTDSEEKRDKVKSSKEKRKKKKEKEKRKRKKIREKSTIKIRKNIKKIIKEIRKILNKQYRNGTRERKRRTRQLKKFVKSLKKQYKKDRKSVKDLHEKEMINIDDHMQKKLSKIKVMNEDFMRNETFRDIVVNGTITKQGARMLLQAYPELDEYMNERNKRSRKHVRRSMTKNVSDEEYDDLVYDIENEYK